MGLLLPPSGVTGGLAKVMWLQFFRELRAEDLLPGPTCLRNAGSTASILVPGVGTSAGAWSNLVAEAAAKGYVADCRNVQ